MHVIASQDISVTKFALCSAYVHVVAQLNASAAYSFSVLSAASGAAQPVKSDELLGSQPLVTLKSGSPDELVFQTLEVPLLFEAPVQNYAAVLYTTDVQACFRPPVQTCTRLQPDLYLQLRCLLQLSRHDCSLVLVRHVKY